MHVTELHRRSVEGFVARVDALSGLSNDGWARPTPCADWDVRALLNHIVYEDLWTVPLMEGATIEEVGDRYDGDLLGDHPLDAAHAACDMAVTATASGVVAGRTVHLSFGDVPAEEYAYQLAADHIIHGWVLAVATGGDTSMDPDMVEALATWFAANEDGYRKAGAIAERPSGDGGPDDPWSELLRAFDVLPVLPEINALQSAMRRKSAEYIAEAEKSGHSEDVCTYVKCDIGMLKKGNIGPTGTPLPKPDLLLLSYTGCFTFMKWFELLRQEYDCPVAMLHRPEGSPTTWLSALNANGSNPNVAVLRSSGHARISSLPVARSQTRALAPSLAASTRPSGLNSMRSTLFFRPSRLMRFSPLLASNTWMPVPTCAMPLAASRYVPTARLRPSELSAMPGQT